MSATAKSALPWIGAAITTLALVGGIVNAYSSSDARQDAKIEEHDKSIEKIAQKQDAMFDLLRDVKEDVSVIRGRRK